MFAGSIPNAVTSSAFVDTATKWRLTAVSPWAPTSQSRAAEALVIVSCVVKVFDAMMNRVVAGSSGRSTSVRSVGSTFETKWQLIARSL